MKHLIIIQKQKYTSEDLNYGDNDTRATKEQNVLLVNNNAFGNPISIKESFDLSLDIIFNGMKSLEGVE
jgi:hypothetical protein